MPIKNWTPERKSRARAQQAQWRKANWDWLKVKQNDRQRRRYANDPAYRSLKIRLDREHRQRKNLCALREAA